MHFIKYFILLRILCSVGDPCEKGILFHILLDICLTEVLNAFHEDECRILDSDVPNSDWLLNICYGYLSKSTVNTSWELYSMLIFIEHACHYSSCRQRFFCNTDSYFFSDCLQLCDPARFCTWLLMELPQGRHLTLLIHLKGWGHITWNCVEYVPNTHNSQPPIELYRLCPRCSLSKVWTVTCLRNSFTLLLFNFKYSAAQRSTKFIFTSLVLRGFKT